MPMTVVQAEPQCSEAQFSETRVGRSRTGELFAWLEEKGFLWMLDSPWDKSLETLAGTAPVTRMWMRKLRKHGGEPLPPPADLREIDAAFERVETIIRERYSVEPTEKSSPEGIHV